MGSHFSAIGWRVERPEDVDEIALRVAEEGERLDAPGGSYRRWAPGGGAELWAQIEGGSELIGLNPHFAAATEVRLSITARPESGRHASAFDGSLHAWMDPDLEAGDPEDGLYPFVFDLPDFRRTASTISLPAVATVQLAIFAEDFAAFSDPEAFDASQEEPGFAPESFIPIGLFGDDEKELATALLHGFVVASELRTNPATGIDFAWMRVRTYGGEIEVVADTDTGAPASVGSIVRVGGWLSGRLLTAQPLGDAEASSVDTRNEPRRGLPGRFGRRRRR